MYVPSHFKMSDVGGDAPAHRRNPFATVAGACGGTMHLAYVPVVLDDAPEPLGGARFHLARANPLAAIERGRDAEVLLARRACLCLARLVRNRTRRFPPGTTLPSRRTGRARAARTRRVARADRRTRGAGRVRASAQAAMERPPRSNRQEIDKLLAAIVGFRVVFETLEGKAKLSQNKSRGRLRRRHSPAFRNAAMPPAWRWPR